MTGESWEVLVVGGGHAGCEAALSAARMGRRTALVTLSHGSIGVLSCNPAIGGVGKGQLVREVDALGGEIARAADATGLQFRTLNLSKGPAVQSTRVQVDRTGYPGYMQSVVARQENLSVLEAEVTGLVVESGCIRGVATLCGTLRAPAVVLAPGTFLNGLIHVGMRSFPGGRLEDKTASVSLSGALRREGFAILRFKTGTCARLAGDSMDLTRLKAQHGDHPPRPFSLSTRNLNVRQLPCYMTYTNEHTHDIIRRNLGLSPLFSGRITGVGVRYCPSLEDKVVKFPHHERHHIFLEPESASRETYYPNGLSTSLPEDVQDAFIRTIPGLERARIVRYGYGIEYDVVDPTQIAPTFETKAVRGLFLAGQINGTTGYEEAAAQGIVAGINAALRVRGEDPLVLDRSTSYIGVLADDLATKGTNEPYRMFTSRAEYRLRIREDNADLRLRETGFRLGLVRKEDWEAVEKKRAALREVTGRIGKAHVRDGDRTVPLLQVLRKPGTGVEDMKRYGLGYPDEVLREVWIDLHYAAYVQRQEREIREFRGLEQVRIPSDFDYSSVPGLSLEILEKLGRVRPETLGQAGRIPGMTPAAVAVLMALVRGPARRQRKQSRKTLRRA